MTARLHWSLAALALISIGLPARAQVYCNVTDVSVTGLTNGASITIQADGILEQRLLSGYGQTTMIRLSLTNARSRLKDNTLEPKVFPISHIMCSVPQTAQNGIGLEMDIALTEPSDFSLDMAPNQQALNVTIKTKRTVDTDPNKGGRGDRGAAAEAEKLSMEYADGKLSLRAVKADIHQVVAEMAQKAGLNIAIDDEVKHEVSMNVTNMDPRDVLRGIAAGYGLALSTVGDVFMLSEGVPRNLPTYNRSGTASFPMKYLKADAAASLLPTFLFKYLHVNAEQNAVVVTAPTQMLKKIGADLKAMDAAPPLIMLEAVAVELTDTSDLERSLNGTYSGHDTEAGLDTESGDARFAQGSGFGVSGGVISTVKLAGTLQSLLSKGKAQIKTSPRMAAINGRTAQIFIGAQRFIQVSYLLYGQQQDRIQSIPVGVRLTVTPWTGGNSEITSEIAIEVSNIQQIDPGTGLPLLGTRKATTTVRARDDETIVIGGLTQRQKETLDSKIPLLGDIPLLGALFRSKSETSVDSQLVIFVTPRILDENGRLSDQPRERDVRGRFLEPGDMGYEAPGAGPKTPK